MKIEIDARDSITIVRPVGRIDALSSPELSDALAPLLQGDQPRIVLDLAAAPYVSSAGLRVLIQAAKQVMGRGKLATCNLTPGVRQVFELAGFDRILSLAGPLDDALAAVRS